MSATGADGVACGMVQGAPCATIDAALQQAADGDTISIAPGVYVEILRVEKSVSFIGADVSAVTIKPPATSTSAPVQLGTTATVDASFARLTVEGGILAGGTVTVGSASTLALSDVAVRASLDPNAPVNSGLNVADGSEVTITNSSLSGFSGFGALLISASSVTMTDSTLADSAFGAFIFQGQLTMNGGAVENNSFVGIAAGSPGDVITLTGTSITHNGSAEAGTFTGGVVLQSAGDIIANGVTFENNYAGIMLGGGSLSLTDSVVRGSNGDTGGAPNSSMGLGVAALGGVLQAPGSTTPEVSLVRSEISGNRIGLAVIGANATVSESTIAHNSLFGIQAGGNNPIEASVLVTGSTIANNGQPNPVELVLTGGLVLSSAVQLLLGGSIVQAPAGVPACVIVPGAFGEPGQIIDGGYNVVSDASCALTGSTSQSSTDALLEPLAANGGVGLTMLPDAVSPVVDSIPVGALTVAPGASPFVDAPLCAAGSMDNRGMARPQDAGCEAGAVEILLPVVPDPVVISPDALPDGEVSEPYSQTVTATGGNGGPYEWAITAGSLPGGLELDPATGEISGVPTIDGLTTFTVSVVGQDASKEYSILVAPAVVVPPTDPPIDPSTPPTDPNNPAPPTKPAPDLASTGADFDPALAFGAGFVLLLGLGLTLVAYRRRQTSD